MKKSSSIGALIFASLLTTAVGISRTAAAQAPEIKLTHEQFTQVELAWNHLRQAARDLVSVSPDVKGDTSRLEEALKAAVNDLHLADPHGLPATTWYPGYDKGKSRTYILNAVQGHLDAAKKVIAAANVKSPHIDQALAEIDVAYKELDAARTAPVSTPTTKSPGKTATKKAPVKQ